MATILNIMAYDEAGQIQGLPRDLSGFSEHMPSLSSGVALTTMAQYCDPPLTLYYKTAAGALLTNRRRRL